MGASAQAMTRRPTVIRVPSKTEKSESLLITIVIIYEAPFKIAYVLLIHIYHLLFVQCLKCKIGKIITT